MYAHNNIVNLDSVFTAHITLLHLCSLTDEKKRNVETQIIKETHMKLMVSQKIPHQTNQNDSV